MSETSVLMTGAYGRIGTALIRHLGDAYDWTFLDLEDHPDHETYRADVRDYEAIRPAFEDQDAVVHLALAMRDARDEAGWTVPLADELQAIASVYGAAVDAGVDSFVYASSAQAVAKSVGEWAIKRYHPEAYDPDFEVLDETAPIRPNSEYALSKAFGEDYGRYCHERFGLSVYALRIGWVLAGAEEREVDHPYATAERGVEERRWERDSHEYHVNVGDPKWCSHRDIAQLVDRCLRDESVGYDVFYGVSDNEGRWLDIDHAREVLGYEPRDDVAEWDEPPD